MTCAYFILWVIACNNQRCFKSQWKIFGKKYWITYRLIYSIIGTLLHLFIIIICLIFLAKYIFYANEKRIQERIKKAYRHNIKTLNKFYRNKDINNNNDMYGFFLEHYKKDREKEDLFKLSSKHKKNSGHSGKVSMIPEQRMKRGFFCCCCNDLWNHIKIAWIVVTELFLSLFYIEYNEFNIIAMFALSYYIFSGILYFDVNVGDQSDDITCNDDTFNTLKSDQIFFGIGNICQAFSIILPGMCINICQKWKCVYQDYYSPPEVSVTFKGEKFEAGSPETNVTKSNLENKSPGLQPSNGKGSKAENLTFIELRSVLNDSFIRCWIFMLFAVQCIIFLLQPVANFDDYRDSLNEQYNCHCVSTSGASEKVCSCDAKSTAFFIINELCLRLFVPMTLITTLILVVSFEKKFYISRLDAMKYVLSPSSIATLLLIS